MSENQIANLVSIEFYQKICDKCLNNPESQEPFMKMEEVENSKLSQIIIENLFAKKAKESGVPFSCYLCASIKTFAELNGFNAVQELESFKKQN